MISHLGVRLGIHTFFVALDRFNGHYQASVHFPLAPSIDFSNIEINFWKCCASNPILRSNPSCAKQAISQLQLAVTSRAKYYKKPLSYAGPLMYKTLIPDTPLTPHGASPNEIGLHDLNLWQPDPGNSLPCF